MEFGFSSIPFDNKFGTDFDMIKQTGAKTVDLQIFVKPTSLVYSLENDEFEKYFEELKNELKARDLFVYQLHSCWDFGHPENDQENNWPELIKIYEKSFKGAALLNCKYVVIHHRFPFGYEENDSTIKFGFDSNIKFLKQLLPYAAKYGVVLCLENLPFDIKYTHLKETIKAVDMINSPYLKMCLDTGHYNMTDSNIKIDEALTLIGDRLRAVHLHDNLGKYDQHLLPGEGTIDWEKFIKTIEKIGFSGPLSFETCSNKNSFEERLLENKSIINFLKSFK